MCGIVAVDSTFREVFQACHVRDRALGGRLVPDNVIPLPITWHAWFDSFGATDRIPRMSVYAPFAGGTPCLTGNQRTVSTHVGHHAPRDVQMAEMVVHVTFRPGEARDDVAHLVRHLKDAQNVDAYTWAVRVYRPNPTQFARNLAERHERLMAEWDRDVALAQGLR